MPNTTSYSDHNTNNTGSFCYSDRFRAANSNRDCYADRGTVSDRDEHICGGNSDFLSDTDIIANDDLDRNRNEDRNSDADEYRDFAADR